jgi:hypothetical protein
MYENRVRCSTTWSGLAPRRHEGFLLCFIIVQPVYSDKPKATTRRVPVDAALALRMADMTG